MRKTVQFFVQAVAAAAVVTMAGPSVAESYPRKPIRVVVPFGPGSGTDIVARIVTEEMRQLLGQPFVIENRAGASGFIGAQAAASALADGYTIMVTPTTTQSINPGMFKKLPYDPVQDFSPVGGLTKGHYMVAVSNSVPAKTLSELVSYLKTNENKTTYGWGAMVSQLSTVAFLQRVGASSTAVPYKSAPQATTDLIGGQITFMVLDLTSGLGFAKDNRIRPLAVSSAQRHPDLPHVPTMVEAGLPGFEVESWVGMYAPAGTPEPVLEKLNAALQTALSKPAVAQKLMACCASPIFPTTREQFAEYAVRDRGVWSARIKAAGIQPE